MTKRSPSFTAALVLPLLGPLALVASGCSDDSRKAKTAAAIATSTAAPTSGNNDSPLFTSFEFGPYLAAAPSLAASGHQYSIESGYIDLRRAISGANPFDFRLRAVAGLAADGALPTADFTGCAAVKTFTGSATAANLKITGPATKTLAFDGTGFARDEDTDGSNPIDLSKTLSADFAASGGAAVAHIGGGTAPTVGVIQLAGAFAQDISVNIIVADLTKALNETSDDLVIADYGDAKNYNAAVVTFFGGTAAKTKTLRCVVAPKGSVTLGSALYKSVLPLRGITAVFANTAVAASDGNTTWSAQVAGMGGVDPSVP